jgi:hypothetical protein
VKRDQRQTEGTIAMKKFALAAVAVLAATVSLSSVAEAHRHHDDDDFDFRRPHHRHFDEDFVVFRRPDCSTTKIIKQTDFGTKVIILKRCD